MVACLAAGPCLAARRTAPPRRARRAAGRPAGGPPAGDRRHRHIPRPARPSPSPPHDELPCGVRPRAGPGAGRGAGRPPPRPGHAVGARARPGGRWRRAAAWGGAPASPGPTGRLPPPAPPRRPAPRSGVTRPAARLAPVRCAGGARGAPPRLTTLQRPPGPPSPPVCAGRSSGAARGPPPAPGSCPGRRRWPAPPPTRLAAAALCPSCPQRGGGRVQRRARGGGAAAGGEDRQRDGPVCHHRDHRVWRPPGRAARHSAPPPCRQTLPLACLCCLWPAAATAAAGPPGGLPPLAARCWPPCACRRPANGTPPDGAARHRWPRSRRWASTFAAPSSRRARSTRHGVLAMPGAPAARSVPPAVAAWRRRRLAPPPLTPLHLLPTPPRPPCTQFYVTDARTSEKARGQRLNSRRPPAVGAGPAGPRQPWWVLARRAPTRPLPAPPACLPACLPCLSLLYRWSSPCLPACLLCYCAGGQVHED